MAAAGNSTSPKQYSTIDAHVSPGFNYYRLRSTDRDSSFSHSAVQVVYFNMVASRPATAFPNPTTNRLSITGAGPGSWLTLTDVLGKMRLQQVAGASGIDLLETSELPSGTYLLHVFSAEGKRSTLRVNRE